MGYGINFGGNNVRNYKGTPGVITDVFAAMPVTANPGTIYYSTDTQEIYQYDNGSWQLFGSGGGGGQSWQDTLFVSPNLNQGNYVDAANNDFYFSNTSRFFVNGFAGNNLQLNELGAIRITANNGADITLTNDLNEIVEINHGINIGSIYDIILNTGSSIDLQSNAVKVNSNYTLPGNDGSAGQSYITDGLGNVSWGNVSGSNIYNSDGTLTSSRSLDGGGFPLTLNNIDSLLMISNNATQLQALAGNSFIDMNISGDINYENDTLNSDQNFSSNTDINLRAGLVGSGAGAINLTGPVAVNIFSGANSLSLSPLELYTPGIIEVDGTSGATYKWGNGTGPPATNPILALPASVYGSTAFLLGAPTGFALINVGGVNRTIPFY